MVPFFYFDAFVRRWLLKQFWVVVKIIKLSFSRIIKLLIEQLIINKISIILHSSHQFQWLVNEEGDFRFASKSKVVT